jgi:hypothetical protein
MRKETCILVEVTLLHKNLTHAANMKAGRVVLASVMMGCYDLQCTCSDVCMLQPYCTRQA